MSKKEKEIKQRLTAKKIKKMTDGVFSTLFDVTLYLLALPICSMGKTPTSRGVYQAFEETNELLKEVNYQRVKLSLNNLKQQGFIDSLKNWINQPIITAAGKKRLKSLIPQYHSVRPWDEKIYLISYDFQVTQNRLRDLFREYIKRLGAIQLQKSLYLVTNNPYQFIEEFREGQRLSGTILISELGKKGFLGKEDLKNFIWQAAGLDKINEGYQEFIDNYRNFKTNREKISLLKLSIDYYSILKDDPQLPFKLLPEEYLGDQAFLLFKTLTKPSPMTKTQVTL